MFHEMRKVCVIGLGYVGLPLAVEFSKKFDVIGFDVNPDRIKELSIGEDRTLEVTNEELLGSTGLTFTCQQQDIDGSDFFIVTVPTPVKQDKTPDLSHLESACQFIAPFLKSKSVVVFESTVYPGCTEEFCAPILETLSGLRLNKDFFCGYSPERINPGDKEHRISDIVKVVSGSTEEAAELIFSVYNQIIIAGVYKAESIKVAEAAKVIENTQRDLNIALVNELAIVFDKMGINTQAVLDAAATKWNFMQFKPGLVGGHCIGVDPYYLTFKAQEVGYTPEIILSGRRLNESMPNFVVTKLVKEMVKKDLVIKDSKVLVMGLTFKENCPDTRNSKVFDLISELVSFGLSVDVFDPWISNTVLQPSISLVELKFRPVYNAVLLAVPHNDFLELGIDSIRQNMKKSGLLFDLKSLFPEPETDFQL